MPLITLLTDFGTSDHFVGVMKGVILGICPEARIVDISHQVTPHQIGEAAFLLAQSWRYFPKGTVHVVVVDPGVGSSRRPILSEAGGHFFVTPDNGLLSFVYAEEGEWSTRHVTAEQFFLQPVSQTFHGRDIFAPVAAHVAAGVAPAQFGPLVGNGIRLPLAEPVLEKDGCWAGTILNADRFGNLITNFKAVQFPQIRQQPFTLQVGQHTVKRLETNYAAAKSGELFLIASSSGYLEIATNQASAARATDSAAGTPVVLRFSDKTAH